MEDAIITPNFENAITITLMAFIGFAIIGLIGRAIMKARASSDA